MEGDVKIGSADPDARVVDIGGQRRRDCEPSVDCAAHERSAECVPAQVGRHAKEDRQLVVRAEEGVDVVGVVASSEAHRRRHRAHVARERRDGAVEAAGSVSALERGGDGGGPVGSTAEGSRQVGLSTAADREGVQVERRRERSGGAREDA